MMPMRVSMDMQDTTLLDQTVERIRELMGHSILDPAARRRAARETFSTRSNEIDLVRKAAKIEGAYSVFKRIIAANNVGDLLDCTAEIRYALVFDGLRFGVKFVPPGAEARPDLLVARDGEMAYVEVRRIRQPDPACIPLAIRPRESGDELLLPYGGEENVRKIEQELRAKFRQILAVSGSRTMIATWCDRDFIEDVDFEEAMRNIRRSPTDPSDGRLIPDGLLFCLFGRFWIDCATGRQLYCEPLRDLTEPFISWRVDLEQSQP